MRRSLRRLEINARAFRALAASGLLGPVPPRAVPGVVRALRRWGPAAGLAAQASARYGDRTALIDDRGSLTYRDLDERSSALAAAWRADGLGAGDGIGILCRNHRYFVDAMLATWKLGGRGVYLNTSFAGPQLCDVLRREDVEFVVCDEEHLPLLAGAAGVRRAVGWCASDACDVPTVDALIAAHEGAEPDPPEREGSVVMLTSGTTGTPKGAPRPAPRSIVTVGALLDRIPLRGDEPMLLGAPMFHAWGFTHASLAIALGAPLVITPRFDPLWAVRAAASHRCTTLVLVPVMLKRILDLGDAELARHDLSAVRIIGTGGSALTAECARRTSERFGDVLHNLYGSTEVSVATIATPRDLREAPGCAGRPVLGTEVRLYDEDGLRLHRPGEIGGIYVRGDLSFEGYTDGGTKREIDGLLSSGDLGYLDEEGRLFVVGRDDDMIVSGAENVFPQEVEELLLAHEAIADAAVVGVPDEEFGQRLRAYVVPAGEPLSADDVRDHVRAGLASFKVPRDVVFIDELPRNPTGKVLKRELAGR